MLERISYEKTSFTFKNQCKWHGTMNTKETLISGKYCFTILRKSLGY